MKVNEIFKTSTLDATLGYYPLSIFNGLNAIIPTADKPVWLTTNISASVLANVAILDSEYMSRSGDRTASTMLTDVYNGMAKWKTLEADIESETRKRIAMMIWTKYKAKWARDWEIYTYTFDVGANYDMEEIETPDISRKHKASADYAESNKHQVSDDYETSIKNSVSNDFETEDKRSVKSKNTAGAYGFNSASSVPVSDNVGLSSDNEETNTHTQTGFTENTGTQTGYTEDIHTQEGYTEDTESGTHTLTRSDNIGITSTIDLLEQASNYWNMFNFFSGIFDDIDKYITNPIWE